MEKDILLTISGLQFQNQPEEEETVPVEVITAGNYYKRNGKHYVLYDEVMEGISGITKNTIKIQDEVVEVVKRGTTNVHMRFEKDRKNVTCYDTPFGNMMVGMQASDLDIQVQEQSIKVNIDYALEINYEYVADCSIHMDIMSKQAQNLNITEVQHKEEYSMKVRKAIIPAAGLGTRFLPATKAQPKEMLPIVDKPTIQYIIEEAVEAGIQDIIIVTGRSKRSIEDHFDRSIELELELEKSGKQEMLDYVKGISEFANIHYIRQKEPRGLGHAILTARHFIGQEPFAVLLGDDIVVSKKACLKQMIDVFDEYKTTVLGVQKVADENVNKYGIVQCKHIDDRVYKVSDLVEKPKREDAPSNIAILGRYIISANIFDYLETQDEGAGGEIQLTDALRRMAKDEAMYAYDFKGHRYDVGTKPGFLQANIEFALRNEETRAEMLEYLETLHDNMEEMLDYE